ncbi:MAG: AMP-binding protein [Oscillospiraceae bacterium]|nr:AMP-binding protein [Oscillospiraceae bacterium]
MKKSALFSSRLSREDPGRPAIVSGGTSCTYAELYRGIDGLNKKLREMGVGKGSRVALWGYNCANWLIAFFAVVQAGGTAVLLNYSMSAEDARELLSMTETDFLLCGDNGETKKEPDAMRKLAALTGIGESRCLDIRPSVLDLATAFPDGAEEPDARTEDEAKDTAFIIFTSGTTSKPKAVQISQRALSFDADAFNGNIADSAGRSVCVAVPLFHILGLLMSYAYLCRGATVCLPANYKPDTLLREIGAHRLSDMAAVGAVYLALAEAEGFEENAAPHLRLCMIAGGMSTPVQMMRLELQFANATFINMYGQSEAAPLTMVRPGDLVEKRAQTVGKPVEGLDVRIADGRGGFLPKGEIGEVVARGDNLMNGYDKLPPEKQPIDENGWLHTGDLGYFDPEGFLHLSGRIKDVIIRGGENISPSEIENALNQVENVRDVKVMGAPHPIYGESVEACVTMTGGETGFDPEKIKTDLRSRLARFKIPSHIFLYEQFPLNVNGKIDQRALRTDLLRRLRALEVDEELAGGVTVFDLVVKNSSYAIVPVTSLVNELASAVGYNMRRALSIRLAVEEMLTERILDAYSAAGDIRVKITLMPEWLRVSFSDSGAEYFIDKRRDTSMSAKIILKAVSDFHTDYLDGKPVYCMDFLYENEFSIQEFLLKSKGDD